jgi:hypothetical protein
MSLGMVSLIFAWLFLSTRRNLKQDIAKWLCCPCVRKYVCCCCQQHFNKVSDEVTQPNLDTSGMANLSPGDDNTSFGESSISEKLNCSNGDKINPGTEFQDQRIVIPEKGENRFNALNSDIGNEVIKEDSEESGSDVENQNQVDTVSKKKVYAKSKASTFHLAPLILDGKDDPRRCSENSASVTRFDSNSENSKSPSGRKHRTFATVNDTPSRFKKGAQSKPHEMSSPNISEIVEQKAQTKPRYSQQLPHRELLAPPDHSMLDTTNNFTCADTSNISIHQESSKIKTTNRVQQPYSKNSHKKFHNKILPSNNNSQTVTPIFPQ